jgi:hypothetical protein
MKQSLVIAAGAIFFLGMQALAAGKLSDQEIARKLVGAWIIPTTSSDYGPENANTVEIFKADGTYALYSLRAGDCKTLIRLAQARWKIENSVLDSFYPAGGTDQDDVVNITDDGLTLHSHSDGTTFTRLKSDICAKLIS